MMRIILPKRSAKCQDHTAKLWIEDPRSSAASLGPISQMRIQRAPIGDKRGQTKGSSETPAGPSAIPASRWPRGSRRYHVPERTEDLEDCRAGPGASMDREPGMGRGAREVFVADRPPRPAGAGERHADGLFSWHRPERDEAVGEAPALALWRRAGLYRGPGRQAGAREVFWNDRPQRPAGAGERRAVGLFVVDRSARQPLGAFVGAALCGRPGWEGAPDFPHPG